MADVTARGPEIRLELQRRRMKAAVRRLSSTYAPEWPPVGEKGRDEIAPEETGLEEEEGEEGLEEEEGKEEEGVEEEEGKEEEEEEEEGEEGLEEEGEEEEEEEEAGTGWATSSRCRAAISPQGVRMLLGSMSTTSMPKGRTSMRKASENASTAYFDT